MSKLVIVESPAKAKTIQKYLGKGYEVTASMGHVRDLPPARLSVDVKKDFAPKYAIIKGKEQFVKDLKKHGPFRAETVRIVFRKGFYSFTQRIDMPCERASLLTLKVRLPLTMNMYWP